MSIKHYFGTLMSPRTTHINECASEMHSVSDFCYLSVEMQFIAVDDVTEMCRSLL